ncbi:neuroligin-3 isoform X2 [Sitodiplosis mosellana]|nr:neuroligin-3 isoform X2 [Sitodiplosis mosellana]XP_055308760.1 neuroligin-3 isoform X2 [Sitodiplosis mosellana]
MFRTQTIVGYLGIPYAQPPLEDRRFAPPSQDPLPSWPGIRNGSIPPMQCWSDFRKPIKNHDEIFFKILGIDPRLSNITQFSEDCLFLNIFLPDEPPPKDGYAVIAVIPGSGDFSSGSSSEINPFQLVFKQKVIVVTIAFRLGAFGFFTTNDGEAPGNYGLMDQSIALLWISRYIHLFNGNPKSVTLMGHGVSGAVSASLHLTSGEWSEGLFHRAIIMSSSSPSTWVRDPRSYKNSAIQVADMFACEHQTANMLRCLRRVDATVFMENNPVPDWTPVIDNGLSNTTTPFVPEDPKMLFERHNLVQKLPVMIGFTDMEDVLDISMREMLDNGLSSEMYTTLISDAILNDISQLEANNETACGENGGAGTNHQPILNAVEFAYKPYFSGSNEELRKKYIDFYVERSYLAPSFFIAKALSRNSEVFMYRFDTKPKTQIILDMLPVWSGVPHRLDQIFVWGMPYWVTLDNQTQWSAEDKRLSDIIMTMWANFAKFSNPTEIGVYIRWANFTETDPGVLIIDRSFNMSNTNTLNYQGVQFWNDYYPKVINFATQCCNITNGVRVRLPQTIVPIVILAFTTLEFSFN